MEKVEKVGKIVAAIFVIAVLGCGYFMAEAAFSRPET